MGTDALLADAIEADAWEDMFAAAPAALGLVAKRVAGALVLHTPVVPIGLFNRVIGFGNEGAPTEAGLDAVMSELGGSKAALVHVHEMTRDRERVEAWLAARGMKLSSRPYWTKFVRGTEPPPVVRASLEVREVDRAHESSAALARALLVAHEMPPPMAPWIEALVGRPRWRAYALFDGDDVVGGGFSFTGEGGVWLGMAGTLASHRGRGGQKAVMARRVSDAIASGATAIATETGEPVGDEVNPSHANMIWCGFAPVARRANWSR